MSNEEIFSKEFRHEIWFSHDYEKLPQNWENTQAVLIAVDCYNLHVLNYTLPSLLEYDTRFRGEQGHYDLNFREAILLIFIHERTGQPFTTIRLHTTKKLEYYTSSIYCKFTLRRAKEVGDSGQKPSHAPSLSLRTASSQHLQQTQFSVKTHAKGGI